MTKTLDVICIGRSSVDLYGQQVGGRLEEMASFAKYVGGCPTNISIGTARLGLKPGLVHLSGVDDQGLPLGAMRDSHRGLVGPDDRLGNIAQIIALLAGGYDGPFSFEPFSASVHGSHDIAGALERSIHWLDAELAKAQV